MTNLSKIDRIVIVHDRVIARGGASGLARLSALQYASKGYKVTFLNGEGDDAELSAAGVECIGLGQQSLMKAGALKAMKNGFHNGAAKDLIESWIADNDTPRTVYHLHNWAQILSPAVFQALKPVESRTVMSCHDFFNVCPNGGFLHFSKAEVCTKKPMSAGCWASQCDRRSPVHKYWRMARTLRLDAVADFKNSKISYVTLHEGMNDIFRTAGFDAPDLRTIRNPSIPYTTTRIDAAANTQALFVGRINKEKGADAALEATARAGMPIIMVGEGDDTDALAERYPHAEFAGFCDREGLARHAARARLLIMPSRWREPFGMVTLEAALSGLPVLISGTCTLAPDIGRIGAGRVIDVSQLDEMTGLLKALAADDKAIDTMSHIAFNDAKTLCNTPSSWADGFLDLFSEKLAKSAAA